MTALEMKNMAEIAYEAMASGDAPGYTPYHWSFLLSEAQENVIKDLIIQGIEYNDTTKLVLGPKVKSSVFTGSNILDFSRFPNGNLIDLDIEDYWGIVLEVLNDDPTIKVIPISYGFYGSNIENPYKKPGNKRAWRLVYDNQMVVITVTDYIITKYEIYYLDKPEAIIVPGFTVNDTIDGTTVTSALSLTGRNCEFHNIIHKTIVRRAAVLAKMYISDFDGFQAHINAMKI